MTKVSIILTTYNHKNFIKDTIESVLNQSFSSFELLIGDDSPDNETWNIIEEYTKKYDYIHAWHHSPNKGIVENMNFLINKIDKNSDFVVFLEGDDILKGNYLEGKLRVFNEYPKVNLVYNNLDFINSKGEIIQKDIFGFRRIRTYKNQKISCDDFILQNVGPIISWSTIMVRKSIVDKYKIKSLYPENKNYAVSDCDFSFEVSTENYVYYLQESLTLYRRHSSNLSAGNINLLMQLSDLVELYYKEGKISKNTLNYKLSQNNIIIALMLLEKGDKKESYKYLKQSFNYSIFNSIILKLGTLLLLMTPSKITKLILSKIIKRN